MISRTMLYVTVVLVLVQRVAATNWLEFKNNGWSAIAEVDSVADLRNALGIMLTKSGNSPAECPVPRWQSDSEEQEEGVASPLYLLANGKPADPDDPNLPIFTAHGENTLKVTCRPEEGQEDSKYMLISSNEQLGCIKPEPAQRLRCQVDGTWLNIDCEKCGDFSDGLCRSADQIAALDEEAEGDGCKKSASESYSSQE